jgi:hypothetical protein
MLSAHLAHTTRDIGGIGAMLEVVPAGCRYGGLKRCRPFMVGLGEPPHLIGSQAEGTERRPDGWPL